jgi:uncharacterized protein YdeI (YjbR/CyaY-like superfamily)
VSIAPECRPSRIRYFKTAAAFRAWLESHHATTAELWVGFYKKQSGRGGLSYKEAVDHALCYGWIDGLVRGVDEVSYAQRFTPRKARSHWSAVNRRRVTELRESGLMTPAGLKAFAADNNRTAPYSYEQPPATLSSAYTKQFRAQPLAWKHFTSQPPGYQRLATFWVMIAKKEETRARRLATLIADSAAGRRIKQLT